MIILMFKLYFSDISLYFWGPWLANEISCILFSKFLLNCCNDLDSESLVNIITHDVNTKVEHWNRISYTDKSTFSIWNHFTFLYLDNQNLSGLWGYKFVSLQI